MTCETVPFADGIAWLCNRSSRKRVPVCSSCRQLTADRLCDFPLPSGEGHRKPRTCSAPLCERCAVPVGEDVDYCRSHGIEAVRVHVLMGARSSTGRGGHALCRSLPGSPETWPATERWVAPARRAEASCRSCRDVADAMAFR